MRKRIASIVLSVCLCLTLLPTAAFAEGTESNTDPAPTTSTHAYDSEGFCTGYKWENGVLKQDTCTDTDCNGYQPATATDSDDYYEIGNAGQLYWFAAKVNGGTTTINAKLTENITINDHVLTDGALSSNSGNFRQWTPIAPNGYYGTFDGNNNTLSGLYYSGNDGDVGLFACVYGGGAVQNLMLTDSYINSQRAKTIYIGGIVGDCTNGTIKNCTVSNTVIRGTQTDEHYVAAGGIVGQNANGMVTRCTSSATVSATSRNEYSNIRVGGIVGLNMSGTVSFCANSGAVSGIGVDDASAVGGVAGYNMVYIDSGSAITDCYNIGIVSGSGNAETCGGVVGYNSQSTIKNCYSTGAVSGGSTNGGVLGDDYESGGTITNCYYKADSETDDFNGTTCKAETDFESGEVAWLLNGETSTGDLVWYQNLAETDGDAAPTLDSSRGAVYCGYTTCAEDAEPIYTNTASDVSATKPSHIFDDNGDCTGCTAVRYTVTFNPDGGTMDTDTATTNTVGKLTSLPTATRGGYTFNGWYTAADGGEKITTETVFDGHTTVYAHWTVVSSGGSSSNTTSTTVKNEDGSTTTTVTNKVTGTVTETTKNTDGSTTTIETKKDGTVTETNKTATGTTSTTVTDKDGNSTTTVSVSKKDAQSGETVTLPVDEVNSKDATEITVKVPSGGATIEVPVKNPTAGTVIVIVDKDGNETVVPTTKQTENGVSVTLIEDATIKVIENSKTFSDVKDSDYFDKAVDWASSRGITGGNSATTFGPHDSCTRAQLVTFLWRVAGCPAAEYEMNFSDVGSSYYTEAVRWAASLGIVGGYGNGRFGAEDTITREQMAVILYRFAQAMGMDTTQGGMSVREYKDYESVSDYAVAAIQWAVNAGVMQGYDGNLMPDQPCTRAQIVTMLYRLLGA